MTGPETSDVWVVLPTYNEAENLERIVPAILEALGPHPGHRVLVVDDGSPDGTGQIAEELRRTLGRVEVLHRTAKQGIGRAYLAGFAHALAHGADRIVEMDADFSHDPAALPTLLAAAPDADLVIGSRYVPGGSVQGWGLGRRLLSRGGSLYSQILLRVRVRDLTGGFKCFSRDVLTTIPLDEVRSNGYAFQIELTYRTLLAGFRAREVPITFRDREAGTSKMSARIALEAVWMVPSLRLAAQRERWRGDASR